VQQQPLATVVALPAMSPQSDREENVGRLQRRINELNEREADACDTIRQLNDKISELEAVFVHLIFDCNFLEILMYFCYYFKRLLKQIRRIDCVRGDFKRPGFFPKINLLGFPRLGEGSSG